mgnify:CR=1 FL=1
MSAPKADTEVVTADVVDEPEQENKEDDEEVWCISDAGIGERCTACTCLYAMPGIDARLLCCWRCRDVVLASDCLVGRSVRSDQEEEKEEARQDR